MEQSPNFSQFPFMQLYEDIIRPNCDVRGKALVQRRLSILRKAIQSYGF